ARPRQRMGIDDASILRAGIANAFTLSPQRTVPRPCRVDPFTVDLEPLPGGFQLARSFGMKLAVRTWADSYHEAAAFRHGIHQVLHDPARSFVLRSVRL